MRALVSTQRRQRQPAIAVLVAWLCLVLQASAFAHGALVRHSFCFEHGELTHAAEPEAPAQPLARASVGSGDRQAIAAQDVAAAALHEHEHCAIFALRKAALPAGKEAQSVAVPPLAATIEAWHVAGQIPAPSLALLLLAPKTSPPA